MITIVANVVSEFKAIKAWHHWAIERDHYQKILLDYGAKYNNLHNEWGSITEWRQWTAIAKQKANMRALLKGGSTMEVIYPIFTLHLYMYDIVHLELDIELYNFHITIEYM